MGAYDKYIDTGIDWLGKIPKSWHRTQLRYLTSISKGRKAQEDYQDFKAGLIPYLSMEYLRSQTESPTYVSENDPNIVLVDERDLLILWDGSKAGEIVKAKSGALSSTMGKIHLNSELIDLAFLTYYLKSAESHIQSNTVGMGIPHVSGDVLKSLAVTFPDLKTQFNIVSFLNHQTSIVDQLIQHKEKLIELLKEKRQAIINEAVTKGLNSNAKMKDSGIEWLGEVPEHWTISKAKYISHLITDGAHISPDLSSPDYPFVSTVDLNNGEIDFDNCLKTSSTNFRYLVRTGCQPIVNDVLYSKDGTIGKTTVVKESRDFAVASSLIIVRPKTSIINSTYLEYLLRSRVVNYQIESVLSGVALRRVSLLKFSNLILVIPPVKEQILFIETVHTAQEKHMEALKSIKKQIEILREYRQSVVSEAVTGKIDLRDWQPNQKQLA